MWPFHTMATKNIFAVLSKQETDHTVEKNSKN